MAIKRANIIHQTLADMSAVYHRHFCQDPDDCWLARSTPSHRNHMDHASHAWQADNTHGPERISIVHCQVDCLPSKLVFSSNNSYELVWFEACWRLAGWFSAEATTAPLRKPYDGGAHLFSAGELHVETNTFPNSRRCAWR